MAIPSLQSNSAFYDSWELNKKYVTGDTVTYNSKKYVCTKQHHSNAELTPNVLELWLEVEG